MLTLKNVKKSYTTGDFTQVALDGVSLNFRENEFVAILGPSGSGKTTCLNVIGGLDKYDSGDLIINGKSTKKFSDSEWDSYRNNSVGFIFQSYNLIGHLDIVSNVEMGMTLSGISSKIKRQKALEALERVGLKNHIHKKPNQLSGGQMQRVAIARALANDPEIILADEPTGALDTKTSVQIMELIKEISKEKLVIMVTHNPELAKDYADRIVEFRDGNIVSDSNPLKSETKKEEYSLKKTSMSFFTALKLSAMNIKTKKGRTFLTALASSIGIIGIAVILSLSNGFDKKIAETQEDTLSEYPITIDNMVTHTNNISDDYIEYIKNIDPEIVDSIGYTRIASMNLLRKVGDEIKPITFSADDKSNSNSLQHSQMSSGLASYPCSIKGDSAFFIEKNYDLLEGEYPKSETDLVLVVDADNRVDVNVMKNLGIDTADIESIKFKDLVGMEFKLISNNDYYEKTQFNTYMPSSDYEKMYNSNDTVTLTLSGIVRIKDDVGMSMINEGIAYSDDLTELVIEKAKESDIVKAQKDADYNVITRESVDEETKNNLVAHFGGDATPYAIMLYPTSFEEKDQVISYLDDYNEDKSSEDKIVYTDLSKTISDMTGGIMDGITIVLVAFAATSLVVSLIMVGIITYISVLERTKEIGILRALGARKKDITRVFNAETFIIGASSGILGISIAWLLTIPINNILYKMTDLESIAKLNPVHAVALLLISLTLTMIGGWIPSKMAARKNPVEALRSE